MKTYTIKPLVWNENIDGSTSANMILGSVTVEKSISVASDEWITYDHSYRLCERHESKAAAQAAAETWYDARMIEGLEIVTTESEVLAEHVAAVERLREAAEKARDVLRRIQQTNPDLCVAEIANDLAAALAAMEQQ